MALLDRVLQILRIMVRSADDDQILAPPGYEEPAAIQKSEIASAEKRPFARGQIRAESFLRVFRLAPVACRNARSANPDFSDAIRSARCVGFGIDDRDPQSRRDPAAAHQFAAALRRALRGTDAILPQFPGVDR